MAYDMSPVALVSWLRARARGCRTEADHLDAAADRLVMLADRVVSVPTVQREVAEVPLPSKLTVTHVEATVPRVVTAIPHAPTPPIETSAMTADEVCRRLGCAGHYITPLTKHGIIVRSDHVGRMGSVLFDRESVEQARGTWHARLLKAAPSVEPPAPATEPTQTVDTMSAVDVAELLGCSRAYVTIMLQHGVITGTKIATKTGGYWRIDKPSVDAVRDGDAWRGLLKAAMERAKVERSERLAGRVPVVESTPAPTLVPAIPGPVVTASLPPVDEADHNGPQSAVAETSDPVAAKAPNWRTGPTIPDGHNGRVQAALHLGISVKHLDKLVAGGVVRVAREGRPGLATLITDAEVARVKALGPEALALLPGERGPDQPANPTKHVDDSGCKPRAPVHRQKPTNYCDPVEPFPEGPTVTSLALVMRWGLTMRQLRAIIAEGWVRANGDGEVLEADALWFEKGTGPGSLRQWKKDNVGKGYGSTATSSLGGQEIG